MYDARVREMNDGDLDQVVAVWHAAGVARPWNDPAKDIAFARRNAHSTVLVAILSDAVAATAMVGEDGHRGWIFTSPSIHDTRAPAWAG